MTESIPSKKYSEKEYWETRFKKKKTEYFDWYCSMEELRPCFDIYLKPLRYSFVLMLGCGNSLLSEQLLHTYSFFIINVDIVFSVLKKIKAKTQKENQDFLCDDAFHLSFERNTFDIVLDKGTFDAIACSKNSQNIHTYLKQVFMVLRNEGFYVVITYRNYHEFTTLFNQQEINDGSYVFQLKDCQKCVLSFSSKLRSEIYFQEKKNADFLSLVDAVTELDRIELLQKYFQAFKHLKKETSENTLEEKENKVHLQKPFKSRQTSTAEKGYYRSCCYAFFFSKQKR